MNDRVLNLLSLCMQVKEKGHDYTFTNCSNLESGHIFIWKNGKKYEDQPSDMFLIFTSDVDSYITEAESYLKELISCT